MKTFLSLTVALALCLVPGLALGASGPAPAPAAPASPAEDGTMPALTAIAGEGMMNTHAYDELEDLSDNIGGRVTGSPQAAKAIQWGLARMRAIGLSNVHAEKWQLSHGWTRISASAELTAPIQRQLSVDSMGWVGSTPAGGVDADLVAVNIYQLPDEMKNNSANWAGKVLVVVQKGDPPKDRSDMFATFGKFLEAAYAAHAVAIIGGQGGSTAAGMHLTHTGAIGFDTYY